MKPVLTVISVLTLCGLTACATTPSQSGTGSNLQTIQNRLIETEEKVDQLSQRITLLQIMVDSHQRTLQDMDDTGDVGGKTTADISEPPGASPGPDAVPSGPEPEKTPDTPEPAEPPLPETAETPEEVEPLPVDPPTETPQVAAAQAPATEEGLVVPEPSPLYREAMETFRSGDYQAATNLFETFVQQYPKDDLADNALYWAAECLYGRRDFKGALERFKRVIEEYPSGSKVPDALLKIGYAYISLGDKDSAETYLKRVISQYPFSSAATMAEERLKTLQQ